jgi:hypothetical protein
MIETRKYWVGNIRGGKRQGRIWGGRRSSIEESGASLGGPVERLKNSLSRKVWLISNVVVECPSTAGCSRSNMSGRSKYGGGY